MAPRIDAIDFVNHSSNEDKSPQAENTVKTPSNSSSEPAASQEHDKFKSDIVWRNVVLFVFLHLGFLYGIYLCFYASYKTLFFGLFVCCLFLKKFKLLILDLLFNSLFSIFVWWIG